MIDFSQNLYVEDYSFKDTQELRSVSRGDIPTSEEISGIEVRLSKVFIIDNKTRQFGPFPGLATVYFMNIVLSDLSTSQVDLNLNGFEKVDGFILQYETKMPRGRKMIVEVSKIETDKEVKDKEIRNGF